jgi:hypothetical protein
MHTVIEREGDRARRERSGLKPRDSFTQGKDLVTAIANQLETRSQRARWHVERGIPLVFVGERNAVIREDEHPAGAPVALLDTPEKAGAFGALEDPEFRGLETRTSGRPVIVGPTPS